MHASQTQYILVDEPFSCFDLQILDGQLTDKYHEVKQRVDTKAKAVQEAKKKAESLRDEAKELLRDAQNKLQRLAGVYESVCLWMCVCVSVCNFNKKDIILGIAITMT